MRAIPSPLFEEWRALFDLEPWGDEREDHRHGIACSLLAACHADRVTPKPPAAYLPAGTLRAEETVKPQSEDEMRAMIDAVAARMHQRDKS